MMFHNPGFLFALPLVLIPVIVHLFSFRRYRKVYFSNVAMLEAIQTETRRQSKLKHLLVLASRMLAIAALVTAFAQPFRPGEKQRKPTRGNVLVNLFIDNSFSMSGEGHEGILLEQVRKKALELVDAWPATTRFRVFTHELSYKSDQRMSQQQARQFISSIELTPASRPLSQWFLRQQSAVNPTEQQFTYILSDFQKQFADFEHITDTLQPVTLLPYSPAGQSNIVIDTCYFDSPVLQSGFPLQLKAKISNHSETPFDNLPLRLIINGQQKTSLSVSIQPHQSTEVKLPFLLTGPGHYQAVIETDDMPVTFDNRYFLAFHLTGIFNVLYLFDNKPEPWLKSLFGNDSTIQYNQYSIKELDYSILASQQLVIADALATSASGPGEALATFASEGGSVWINPGTRDEPQAVNQLLAHLQMPRLMQADTQSLRIDMINQQAPLYRGAFESVPINANLPLIQLHFPVAAGTFGSSTPLLTLQNGDPLLMVQPFGAGTVYLFCSPLNTDGGTFVRHGLMVPTFYNAVLLSRKPPVMSHQVMRETTLRLPGSMAEGQLKVESLDGSFKQIPTTRIAGGSTDVFTGSEIPEAGFYEVSNDGKPLMPLAFNYSRAESEPDFQSESELQEQLVVRGLKNFGVMANPAIPAQAIVAQTLHDEGLWKFFVMAVLLFLAIEVILLRIPDRLFRMAGIVGWKKIKMH